MKQLLKKAKYTCETKTQWLKQYLSIRFYSVKLRTSIYFSYILTFSLYFSVITVFFISIGGVDAIRNHSYDILKQDNNFTFNIQDIVITQISSTLLILSVVSFLSSVENVHVYGEKAIELLFPKAGFLSLKFLFFYLVSFMLINLGLLIKQPYSLWIILFFLISIITLIHITLRFATLYISPQQLKKRVQILYLKENHKHISLAKPLQPNSSVILDEFYNKTVEYIEAGNSKYREHLAVLTNLQNTYLFNNRKLVQEYYTELITHSDFIAYTFDFFRVLLKHGRIDEALKLAADEFQRLYFHKIVIGISFIPKTFFHDLNDYIRNIKSSRELNEHRYTISRIIQYYILNLHVAVTSDLSYCRLASLQSHWPSFWIDDKYLAQIYLSICNNKYLSEEEKDELIHSCLLDQLEDFDVDFLGVPFNVDNFRHQKSKYYRNKEKVSDYLFMQPIAQLYLEMYLNMTDTEWNKALDVGLQYKTRNYVKILLCLAFEDAANRKRKECYTGICIASNEQLVKLKENLGIKKLTIKENELLDMYRDMLRYLDKEHTSFGYQTHVYTWNPRFLFSNETIDSVFTEIAHNQHIRWPH